MAPEPTSRLLYPLYNTTFTLHRLSPLYTGSKVPLHNARLLPHARRFRDILAGDVLRGVRVGLGPEDDVLARVGALQTVTWRLLVPEERWDGGGEETQLDGDDTTIGLTASRGILVTITYEKMIYTAIMLQPTREVGGDESMFMETGGLEQEGFQHFPLLLTKMPGSLRETFMEFLASTFDARVSVLHLPGTYLTSAFEKYISDTSISEDGSVLDLSESSSTLRTVIKDVEICIGFDLPSGSTSLKTIDIHIAREDFPRIIAKGTKVGGRGRESPFMEALATYVKAHLALNLKDERVRIVRIACGGFVLGSEGKIKLHAPTGEHGADAQGRATNRLVNGLVELGKGGTLAAGEGL